MKCLPKYLPAPPQRVTLPGTINRKIHPLEILRDRIPRFCSLAFERYCIRVLQLPHGDCRRTLRRTISHCVKSLNSRTLPLLLKMHCKTLVYSTHPATALILLIFYWEVLGPCWITVSCGGDNHGDLAVSGGSRLKDRTVVSAVSISNVNSSHN